MIQIKLSVLKFGRDSQCNVVIDHSVASAVHFMIWTVHFDSDTSITYLHDNSRNGVYVNNELVGKGNCVVLVSADLVEIKLVILFEYFEEEGIFGQCHIVKNWRVTGKLVGSGSFGKVYVGSRINCKKPFAVKVVKNVVANINEAEILLELNHVRILPPVSWFLLTSAKYH